MMCEVGTYWARFNTRVYASRILSCIVKLVDKILAPTMDVISSTELHTDISKKGNYTNKYTRTNSLAQRNTDARVACIDV